MENFAEAISAMERVVIIAERILGFDHHDTARYYVRMVPSA